MQCFCRDCPLATGTGHTTIVVVEAANLQFTGEPKVFTNAGETGGRVNRHFCPVCGSRLFTSGALPGSIRMVQAGTLDDPGSVTPVAAVYLKNRIHWDKVDPGIPSFEAMYPLNLRPQDVGKAPTDASR